MFSLAMIVSDVLTQLFIIVLTGFFQNFLGLTL